MRFVAKKNLKEIQKDTLYRGCTFYLSEDEDIEYEVQNSIFEHCSFRCNVTFSKLKDCKFNNCGFSGFFDLDLSNQKLKKIPDYVFSLVDLTGLWLICNELDLIPGEIKKLTKLKELNLSANRITRIPEEICSYLLGLEYLDLSENKLTRIPDEMGKFPLSSEINLWRNSFSEEEQKRICELFPNRRIDF